MNNSELLQTMVYQDMKDWAEARRLWGRDIIPMSKIIDAYCEFQGWKQKSGNGMDIIE